MVREVEEEGRGGGEVVKEVEKGVLIIVWAHTNTSRRRKRGSVGGRGRGREKGEESFSPWYQTIPPNHTLSFSTTTSFSTSFSTFTSFSSLVAVEEERER